MAAFCTKCLTPDSFPGSRFDDAGVCLPCRYYGSLKTIDWEQRRAELLELVQWGKESKKRHYDCLIGVSGGKDSTRQAFYARDELGLNPLLVSCVYPPEQMTDIGAHNLSNLVENGFDLTVVGPAPRTSKELMAYSFRQWGNLFKASELALYASLPRLAIAEKIPLIFFGENPGLAFGGNTGSTDGDANSLRQANTLGGASIGDWVDSGIQESKMYCYRFPTDEEINQVNIKMVYLGYYIQDFNDSVNSQFAREHGVWERRGVDADPAETGSINTIDAVDDDFVHVNQYLKYLKHGFGKVTQQTSVQIRLGNLTRDEAKTLVAAYDGNCSRRYIERLCNYLKIERVEFDTLAESFRNLDHWVLDNHGNWRVQ